MDTLPWWVFLIALIVGTITITILLDVRKRREVLDLMPGEARALKDLQETAKWPKEMKEIRPDGKPLYSDGLLGHIRIYQNGIKARFAIVDKISLLRSSTGYQKRHVARYITVFYPYEMIAAMYPIKIGIIRKIDRRRRSVEVSDDGIRSFERVINNLWALADDHLRTA